MRSKFLFYEYLVMDRYSPKIIQDLNDSFVHFQKFHSTCKKRTVRLLMPHIIFNIVFDTDER